ncbi:MAG: hypothetical protein IT492_20515 [Gammaproteobacteria bacterium]|nr:hypothetical protein [Gammaproteobacteria bacterium]
MSNAREFGTPLPPLWLAFALLGWGLLTDNLAGALVMALLVEGIRYAPLKWALAEREFHRAADLTSVVFALITAVQFSRYSVHGIYQILKVAPYCFFPLVLVQRASTAQTIPMSALFYSLRRQRDYAARLDVAPYYLAMCLLAASTGAVHDARYGAFCVAIVLGLLSAARPRRYAWTTWMLCLALSAGLALLTQMGVLRAQRWVEDSVMYWVNQFPWAVNDANREVTAIGAIGRLKLSDQIRLRVSPGPEVKLPLLLQEASYDVFHFGTWSAQQAPFAALDKRAGAAVWDLDKVARAPGTRLQLSLQHRRELSLLPAPRGTRVVASNEIAELQRNRFGALMAESPPGALSYTVEQGPTAGQQTPPTTDDSAVPPQYRALLDETLAEVGIDGLDAAQRTARIRAFFLDHFKYSLIQPDTFAWRTPLADFLRNTRRGHCEYFATASVLLLRAAGIPARYAVGYMVDEYSPLERAYIARARHAHAWALAFVDGQWQVIDSTPATWYELEDARATDWQTVQDLAAWVVYRYQRLAQANLSDFTDQLLWLVPPLAALLYWRLRRSPLAVRNAARSAGAAADAAPSLLAPLLEALAAAGQHPAQGETVAHFLRRAAPATRGGVSSDELVRLYYQLRYGPAPDAVRARFIQCLIAYCGESLA